jgi:hypothetical protein
MEKYYGNYLGIVVNSSDPENRNRLQVWIPNLTNTLYTDWNTDLTNKTLEYNGLNDSNPVFIRLKNSLPWAECASPLIGGGTAMNINPAVENTQNGSTVNVPVEDRSTPSGETTTLDTGQVVDAKTGEPIFDPNVTDIPSTNVTTDVTTDENGVVQIFPEDQGSNPEILETPLPPENKNWNIDQEVVSSVPTGIDPEGNPVGIASPNVNIERSDGNITQDHVGKTRNRNLSENLSLAIQNGLAGTGLNWNSTSGGQPTKEEGGARVGSTRHDNGDASDGQFIDSSTGRTLNPSTSLEDRTRIQNALTSLTNSGIKGVGWGTNYMGDSTFHLDIKGDNNGGTLVWGANGASKNAASWVKSSVNSASSSPQLALNNQSNPVISDPLASAIPAQGNPSPAGAAKGVISSPTEGARVWVFFYGGDIQKPVYFASAISEYGQAYQA